MHRAQRRRGQHRHVHRLGPGRRGRGRRPRRRPGAARRRHPRRRRRALRPGGRRAPSPPRHRRPSPGSPSQGARFDRKPTARLRLGLEGAHGRRRIVHAHGDGTGAELSRPSWTRAPRLPSVSLWDHSPPARSSPRRTRGRRPGRHPRRPVELRTDTVVLATGGIGGLFSHTTNPLSSRGQGLALAHRAGATLRDVEMVQFHPTALDVGIDPMPLVSEAVRGEGAILVNERGEWVLANPLSARDVVSRAEWAQLQAGHRVFLDARRTPRRALRRAVPADLRHRPRVRARSRRGSAARPSRPRTTTWVACWWTSAARPPCPACTPPARSRPPGCTAPTGWPATPCSKPWSADAGSPGTWRTPRRAAGRAPPAARTHPGRAERRTPDPALRAGAHHRQRRSRRAAGRGGPADGAGRPRRPPSAQRRRPGRPPAGRQAALRREESAAATPAPTSPRPQNGRARSPRPSA